MADRDAQVVGADVVAAAEAAGLEAPRHVGVGDAAALVTVDTTGAGVAVVAEAGFRRRAIAAVHRAAAVVRRHHAALDFHASASLGGATLPIFTGADVAAVAAGQNASAAITDVTALADVALDLREAAARAVANGGAAVVGALDGTAATVGHGAAHVRVAIGDGLGCATSTVVANVARAGRAASIAAVERHLAGVQDLTAPALALIGSRRAI